jgi:FtsZ-interacting cell division protein YlmF
MATNTNVQKAVSITNSVFNDIAVNNVTNADIASKNLNNYKNIVFVTPYNYRDLSRITQGIDNGTAVTYQDITGKSRTITPGILKK